MQSWQYQGQEKVFLDVIDENRFCSFGVTSTFYVLNLSPTLIRFELCHLVLHVVGAQ